MHKILLVDDVKLLLELQKRFLASSVVQLFTASDGLEALQVARQVVPDLIVMDKYMPNMDGLACCREMKSDPALCHIPVIMVSNATHPVEMAEFKGMGIDTYLAKPLDGRLFLNAIKTFIPSIERRDPRLPCRMEVRLTVAGSTHAGVSEDISQGGIFVGTHLELNRGEELGISFVLPGSDVPTEACCRVAWRNKGSMPCKPQVSPGIGIEFIKITGSGMPLLRSSELKSFISAIISTAGPAVIIN